MEGLARLVWVVERLLGPGGCPWDREQTHDSLKKHLLEESYELFDAIDADDSDAIREELGDVLLQPLMHAEMKRLEGAYGIDEVAGQVADKLVRRHPHVFGDSDAKDSDEVLRNWDAIKKKEGKRSPFDGVPPSLPALARADQISRRAARQGFEWPDIDGVWEKLNEEIDETKAAETQSEREHEIGDMLFTIVNIARWMDIDPEEALRKQTRRFEGRFNAMAKASPKPLNELSAEEWDELWESAKGSSAGETSL